MMDIVPPLWRKIKVSGAITLAALQDRILQPVLGWCRAYHSYYVSLRIHYPKSFAIQFFSHTQTNGWMNECYLSYQFTDLRDGALFGPISEDKIDDMHRKYKDLKK